MKLNGKKFSGPNTTVVVIPRDQEDIVFKCQAVLDYKPFDAILPRPEPRPILRPGQKNPVKDENDPAYLEALDRYAKQKMDWMILQTLAATPNLEWEKVDLSNPDTWHLYEEELRESGLVEREIVEILQNVFKVNSMTEEVFKQARERFLATQANRQE